MESFNVIKGTGEEEKFNLYKLQKSLTNAGAGKPVIKSVINSLEERGFFTDGITTKKIYREAYRLLKKRSNHVAGRYKLKEALLELGPSGYPFEILVSEIFKHLGYKTSVGKIVKGKCVSHEIDVIAEDDQYLFMIECKFHNRKGHNSSIKTPLYIQSRFLDVRESWRTLPEYKNKEPIGYIVTNTRFTSDAIDYANCMNLKLLSWDYPQSEGLKELIGRTQLHPITSLSSLTKKDKALLLDNNIIHCQQICENKGILDQLRFTHVKKNNILSESEELCSQ